MYTFISIFLYIGVCIHKYIYIYAKISAGDQDFCTQISKWVIVKEVASEFLLRADESQYMGAH